MMDNALLRITDLCVNFDGVHALKDFSCTLKPAEILGLVGPNGAGKTTLFNVIGGFTKPEAGRIFFEGNDIRKLSPHKRALLGIARTFQKLRLIGQISVLDNLLLAFREHPGDKLINTFFLWRKVQQQETLNRQRALSLLTDIGLETLASVPASDLSYGQQKLLNLVCCLASPTKLLLLDEPIAGVTPVMGEKILALISALPKQGTSIILIEHDINALIEVSERMIFMDAGKNICEGKPEIVCNDARVLEAYLG